MRYCRIDELPQLISVIKGDMSLIGPRPERPEIDEILTEKIQNYKLRYSVKWIKWVGPSQLSLWCSIIDAKNKLAFDLFYIKITL